MTKKTRIANAQARESTPAPALGQEVLQGVQIVKTADNKGGAVLLNGTNRDAFKYCGSSHSPSFNVTLFREVLACISQMRAQFSGVFSGICIINQLDSDHFGEVLWNCLRVRRN